MLRASYIKIVFLITSALMPLLDSNSPIEKSATVSTPAQQVPARPRRLVRKPSASTVEPAVVANLDSAAPEVAPQAAPIHPFQRFSELKLRTGASYAGWAGVDPRNQSRATLITNMNVGLEVCWTQHWSPGWRTLQTFGFTRFEIRPDTGSQLPIENLLLTAPRFGIGAAYASDSWDLGGQFFYGQQLYYRGRTGFTGIILEGVMVPELQFWVAKRLVQAHPFELVVEARAMALAPVGTSAYATHWGFGYRGKLEIAQSFRSLRVSAGASYQFLSQNTSILNLYRRDIGFELGVSWRLGE